MMKKIYIFFLVTMSFACISCKQDDNAAEYVRNLNTSDTFFVDIANYGMPELDSTVSLNKRKLEAFLNLESLGNGYDSIQIRIYWECVMGGEELITLKNDKKNWSAEIGRVKQFHSWPNDTTLMFDSAHWYKELKTPKSGWEKFITNLFQLQILTLPDNNKIPDFHYNSTNDGCGVGFEIATKNVYRFYNYDNPDMYDTVYWQAKNVMKILNLINDEFRFKEDIWPGPESYKQKKIDTIPPKKNEIFLKDIPPDTTTK